MYVARFLLDETLSNVIGNFTSRRCWLNLVPSVRLSRFGGHLSFINGGAPQSWGYLNSWMVSFMEKCFQTWMISMCSPMTLGVVPLADNGQVPYLARISAGRLGKVPDISIHEPQDPIRFIMSSELTQVLNAKHHIPLENHHLQWIFP